VSSRSLAGLVREAVPHLLCCATLSTSLPLPQLSVLLLSLWQCCLGGPSKPSTSTPNLIGSLGFPGCSSFSAGFWALPCHIPPATQPSPASPAAAQPGTMAQSPGRQSEG
jgi:hypothetical protein